eukprot:TRINITY_DN36114_c0_g1_i1.p1 TRINITY_DN36114_c0_g1~~TRINITY_DN36114_c0_g1_i1.p1  ORF type:complete len:140 (-),score=19.23 TRINITY_DN36114_c0_g1_i1:25-381(-)
MFDYADKVSSEFAVDVAATPVAKRVVQTFEVLLNKPNAQVKLGMDVRKQRQSLLIRNVGHGDKEGLVMAYNEVAMEEGRPVIRPRHHILAVNGESDTAKMLSAIAKDVELRLKIACTV